MKKFIYILAFALPLIWTAGCSDDDMQTIGTETPSNDPQHPGGESQGIPEGYFEVVFSAQDSRAPVTGTDGRVRDVRYLLFKSTGEFVKERHLVAPTDPVSTWPLAAVRDTLPKGSYQAVFLGNVEKTLFPYPTTGNPQTYADVLAGYQSGYSSARILLPPAEFNSSSEYYMANVIFSDATPNPYILLQRIIGMLNLHRNFVDAQTALNALTANIFNNVKFKDQIRLQVQNTLGGLIFAVLDKGALNGVTYALIGGIDAVVAALTAALIEPVTDALYNLLVAQLVNQIGLALTGNADQSGLLAYLGVLLNPWATSQADSAIVTINEFPQSVDFNLNVKSTYTGQHKFKFKFTGTLPTDEKDILIKGFTGLYDVRRINVVKTGLVAGLLLDNIVDGPWLLNGTFIDINDPIQFTTPVNRRFKSNYSFIDLGLKSYEPQTQSPKPLSLTVNLGSISNLDGIVKGLPLLGPILNTTINTLILIPLRTVNITVPVNLPLLGVDNLKLSGGWDTPASY